jgi:hypothetical protein
VTPWILAFALHASAQDPSPTLSAAAVPPRPRLVLSGPDWRAYNEARSVVTTGIGTVAFGGAMFYAAHGLKDNGDMAMPAWQLLDLVGAFSVVTGAGMMLAGTAMGGSSAQALGLKVHPWPAALAGGFLVGTVVGALAFPRFVQPIMAGGLSMTGAALTVQIPVVFTSHRPYRGMVRPPEPAPPPSDAPDPG